MASSGSPCRKLEGKVAIVTGGASGIGASAVTFFHENGAVVVIADNRDDLGHAIADKLGESVSYVHCDVSKEDDVSALVDATVSKYGKLDIMYNNAGVIDQIQCSIVDATTADMDRVIKVNLYDAFNGAKHAARVMVPRRRGTILFTTSSCTALAGAATHPYRASKCAIAGMVRSLAAELGQHGIRVNCVSPHAVFYTRIDEGIPGAEKVAELISKETISQSAGDSQGSSS